MVDQSGDKAVFGCSFTLVLAPSEYCQGYNILRTA